MKKVAVQLKANPYAICIGHGILGKVPAYLKQLSLGRDAIIISHPVIERLHGEALSRALRQAGYSVRVFNVPEGEKSKSAAQALRLIEQIAAYDINRQLFVVALGGGVIGDLAGFVAAVYKRGIPYIQIPTTLLAQIDSSIGGKTAIDLKYGKNLVGAFHQPRIVIADTAVLKTLTRRQLQNGLAEAVKYGIIRDPALFAYLEKHHARCLQADPRVLAKMVSACAAIKAQVVAADEFETKGIRTILNFGHTVGHAVELASGCRYQHGEAVALGMRVAAAISGRVTHFSQGQQQRINRLLDGIGLPQVIEKLPLKKILDIMAHDKKFVAGRNRFVLAKAIGEVKVVSGIPMDIIAAAIKQYQR